MEVERHSVGIDLPPETILRLPLVELITGHQNGSDYREIPLGTSPPFWTLSAQMRKTRAFTLRAA